jgi:hypothetical protein
MQEIIEEEVEEEEKEGPKEEEVKENRLKMEVKNEIVEKLEKYSSYEFNAICHTWFIAGDKIKINWRKPYIQKT